MPTLVIVVLVSGAILAPPAFSSAIPRDLDEVRGAFAGCVQQLQDAPAAEASAACFFEVAYGQGLFEEGSRILGEILSAQPENPWLAFHLGGIELELDRPVAEELYHRAAHLFAAQGEIRGELRARANLAEFLFRRGRIEESGEQLNQGLALAESLGQARYVMALQLRLARHWSTLGDVDRGYRVLRQLEGENFPDAPRGVREECLKMLGVMCQRLGRTSEAKGYQERLIASTEEHGDLPKAARAWYNLLTLHLEVLPTPAARARTNDLALKALQAARRAADQVAEAKVLAILGQLPNRPDGLADLERCLDLTLDGDNAFDISTCLYGLAARRALAAPEAALDLVRQAKTRLQSHESPWSRAYFWSEVMTVAWSTLPTDQAFAASWEVLDTLEQLRDLPQAESSRATLFSTWTPAYLTLSGHLLQRAKSDPSEQALQRAFAVTERMRARVMLEALMATSSQKPSTVLTGTGETVLTGTGAAVDHFVTLEQVRRSLNADEALLSFQVGLEADFFGRFQGGSWLLVVTQDDVRVHGLPDRVELEPAIATFAGLFARRDGLDREAAPRLFNALLQTALETLPAGVDRLILIPDGQLHLLPFGGLRSSPEAPPLATRYQITEVPSATLWHHWRGSARAEFQAPALALADPSRSRESRLEETKNRADLRAGANDPSGGRLPYARHEGRKLLQHLGGTSRLLMDDEASEAFLKNQDLSAFAVLHLAAHALVDEDPHGRGSAVLLAPDSESKDGGDKDGGGEDGRLELAEIAELDLDGQLVVLSACRSASGTVLGGEGVQSVARAFFQAGAHTVLGSLWPLRDDDAAAFFDAFYRHLARGRSIAGAVRAAQGERIAAGTPAAAWAGIVVLGKGHATPFPGAVKRPSWPFRLRVLAVLVLAFLARGKILVAAR